MEIQFKDGSFMRPLSSSGYHASVNFYFNNEREPKMKKQNEAKNAQPVDVQVGMILKNARNKAGLSQSDLASASNITFQQVQKYERGSNRISISRLYEFAGTLGLEVHELLPSDINKTVLKLNKKISTLENAIDMFRRNLKDLLQSSAKVLIVIAALTMPSVSMAKGNNAPITGIEQTREGIIHKYASDKFCTLGKPKGRKGSIVIWWTRDAQGKCTVENFEVVK